MLVANHLVEFLDVLFLHLVIAFLVALGYANQVKKHFSDLLCDERDGPAEYIHEVWE
jgi:hypothetical protein